MKDVAQEKILEIQTDSSIRPMFNIGHRVTAVSFPRPSFRVLHLSHFSSPVYDSLCTKANFKCFPSQILERARQLNSPNATNKLSCWHVHRPSLKNMPRSPQSRVFVQNNYVCQYKVNALQPFPRKSTVPKVSCSEP